MPKKYYVYIIRSIKTKSFYTSMTDDIDRRLSQHNSHNKSTITTYKLSDYELVFCQIVESRTEARKLEKFLKSGYGRETRDEIIKM